MTTSTVWKATNSSYGDTCHFGDHAAAVAWARGGDVVPVEVQHYTPPALHVPRTGLLAEAVRMIQGYQRAGWLTNPAAGEQARDFIARASIEPGEGRKGPEVAEWPELPSKTNPDILVDERCMDLAKHFLAGGAEILGEPQDCVANRSSLARDIQQAVEDWFLEASLTKEIGHE